MAGLETSSYCGTSSNIPGPSAIRVEGGELQLSTNMNPCLYSRRCGTRCPLLAPVKDMYFKRTLTRSFASISPYTSHVNLQSWSCIEYVRKKY
ncbi:hypothetical protein J6590_037997 [Homalodisca vitripennis]|nr:hypothetical protein J6590_037997 [Homalodisca vitripennis]